MMQHIVNTPIEHAFQNWMVKYDKHYTDAEYPNKLAAFAENVEKVNRQNAEHILLAGYGVFGTNSPFMDLTASEFKGMYLNYVPNPNNSDMPHVVPTLPEGVEAVASSIDWRNFGAVTPVKDQGQCGSCWAFAATDAIESYAFLSGKSPLQVLSTQQIVSCSKQDFGCQGGWTEYAYDYVVSAGGIELDSSYPYTSGIHGVTGKCSVNSGLFAQSITGYKMVATGESNLATALNSGPPAICLAADAFQTYTGGILTSCPGSVDHCVQAVGYTPTYWIVRNSWGTSWGEEGYIWIARGSDLCQISSDVNYPTFT